MDTLQQLLTHGCSDGYCYIKGPAKGMHTNGGCRCLREIKELSFELALVIEESGHQRGRQRLTSEEAQRILNHKGGV